MKYTFARRVQLKRFFGEKLAYESAEFCVEGADTKEEAVKAVEDWIDEYVAEKKEAMKTPVDIPKEGSACPECGFEKCMCEPFNS